MDERVFIKSAHFLKALYIVIVALCASFSSAVAQWDSPEAEEPAFITIGAYDQITAITATTYTAYFGSTDGVLRYDILKHHWLMPIPSDNSFRGLQIFRIAASFDDERIWIETEFGVFRYDRVFRDWSTESNFPENEMRGEYVPPGHLQIPPPGFHYLPGGQLVDEIGRSFYTEPVYRDENGYLWMNIGGIGPARSEPNGAAIELLPFGLLEEYATAIAEVNDRLWIGGDGTSFGRSGITILDPQTGEFDYRESNVDYKFPVSEVRNISRFGANALISTRDGLFVMREDENEIVESYDRFNGLPNTQVNDAVGFGDTILVATESGLGIITPDSSGAREVAAELLALKRIYALEPAFNRGEKQLSFSGKPRPRYVWVAAENGIFRLDLRDFSLKKLNDPEFILDSPVRQVRIVARNLWALADDGLVRVGLSTGDVQSYPQYNISRSYTAIDVNFSFVALAGSNGLTLFRYQLQEEEKNSPDITFTTSDGLPSTRITALEFVGDYLWITSDRGLTRFWWNDPRRNY